MDNRPSPLRRVWNWLTHANSLLTFIEKVGGLVASVGVGSFVISVVSAYLGWIAPGWWLVFAVFLAGGTLWLFNQIAQWRARTASAPTVDVSPSEVGQAGPVLGSDRAAFDQLHEAIVRANGRVHEIKGDVGRLNSVMLEVLAHSLLFNSLPEPPKLCDNAFMLEPQGAAAEQKAADSYSTQVLRALDGTQWTTDLRAISGAAEAEADQMARNTPITARPAKLDPFDYRAYCIARHRCERLQSFVLSARAEALPRYRSFLTLVRDNARHQ